MVIIVCKYYNGQDVSQNTNYELITLTIIKLLKFIYSQKATKVCEISTVDLSYVVQVKSTVEISQNFVAFSEYMNCNWINGIIYLQKTLIEKQKQTMISFLPKCERNISLILEAWSSNFIKIFVKIYICVWKQFSETRWKY